MIISHAQMAAQDPGILSKFKAEESGERGSAGFILSSLMRKAILNAKRPGNDSLAFSGSIAERIEGVGGNSCGVAGRLADRHAIFNAPSKRGESLCIHVAMRIMEAGVLEFQSVRGSKKVEHPCLYFHFLLVSIWVL